jgi:hypothetical protein
MGRTVPLGRVRRTDEAADVIAFRVAARELRDRLEHQYRRRRLCGVLTGGGC